MKIGIVLDNKVNKWALQRFEPLKEVFDITVFIGERNDYDVSSINLQKKSLNHMEELSLALCDPVVSCKRVVRSPFKRMDFYYFSLKKYLKGFDIVYSCDLTRSAYTLASLKKELGFKLLLAWWENIPHKFIFDEKVAFQKPMILDSVDLFLPFTNDAKENLILEGIPEKKIKAIYPGIDTERFCPRDKNIGMRRKNNIPEDSFVILYVGKLVSWKGVHNLIYAAELLKYRGVKDFVIAVAGRGAQKENMQKIISESGVTDQFRFLDFISYDDMPEIYRMADIFVLPSYPIMTWQEQFGMVLAEAMASGIPVVSTKSGSIPEVVSDAGILIPAGDFKALADSIWELICSPSLREELSRKGRLRAENIYCAKKISRQFIEAINGVV